MRTAGRCFLVIGIVTLLAGAGIAAPVQARAATAGGITIAPAAIRLELAKGASAASVTVNITNTYAGAVTLHFSFEKSQQNIGTPDTARQHLSFSSPDLAVTAGQSEQQIITLSDAAAITPGSQTVDMVVTQGNAAGQSIGVLPSMRLPVTIIKQDGAITSLGLTNIAGPSVAMRMPSSIDVTLRNTGNMTAIPRGVVTVESPGGTLLASGPLNEASIALSPDTDKRFTAKLVKLDDIGLPGGYKITVAYGLGGDTAAVTAQKQFLFIAWWHLLIVIMATVLTWLLISHRHRLSPLTKRRRREPGLRAPKRPLLIGRDIT